MIYDVAIVGAGIVGLPHALAAAGIGKHVAGIERDADAFLETDMRCGCPRLTPELARDLIEGRPGPLG